MKRVPLLYLSLLMLAQFAFAQDETVEIAIGGADAVQGDTLCLDVSTNNFKQIISMQFSIYFAWNYLT